MRAQGWYRDPYSRHGERWLSDGRPTALVRDGGIESRDEPPAGLQPIPDSEWQQLQQQSMPWPRPAAVAEARFTRRVAVALGITAACIGQFAIWWVIWGALIGWAVSQAWPASGPGSG